MLKPMGGGGFNLALPKDLIVKKAFSKNQICSISQILLVTQTILSVLKTEILTLKSTLQFQKKF